MDDKDAAGPEWEWSFLVRFIPAVHHPEQGIRISPRGYQP
jgi:hypothetical protein